MKIHYRRGPEVTVYEHELLHDDGWLIVTRAPFRPSTSLLAQVPGLKMREYQAIWFAAEGEWHDLGKIYDLKGALQGYYCDIIRPLGRTAEGLEIDDLFLDLWIFPDTRRTGTGGRWVVLDEEELEEALERGWLGGELAERARMELQMLIARLERGRFPPAFTDDFNCA